MDTQKILVAVVAVVFAYVLIKSLRRKVKRTVQHTRQLDDYIPRVDELVLPRYKRNIPYYYNMFGHLESPIYTCPGGC